MRRHDAAAQNTSVGVNYYLEELARRDAQRQGAEVVKLTRDVRNLTIWIAVLTVANLAFVIEATLID